MDDFFGDKQFAVDETPGDAPQARCTAVLRIGLAGGEADELTLGQKPVAAGYQGATDHHLAEPEP